MYQDLNIIYKSSLVKVINKPIGVLSTDISPLICHRLDRDTSGCIIIAKNQKAKDQIQAQFKSRKVKKIYQAIILGQLKEKKLVIEGWLERDKKDSARMKLNKAYLKTGDEFSEVDKSDKNRRYSKTIIRLVKVIEKRLFTNPSQKEFNYLSHIKAELITGRRHQIRVHMSSINHPIIGDKLYGSKILKKVTEKLNVNRLLLHALQIEFIDPEIDKLVKVKAPLPKEFNY